MKASEVALIGSAFHILGHEVFMNAVNKGFYGKNVLDYHVNTDTINKGERIALMHSELSEALEGIRKPGPDAHCPEFTSEEVELADCVIRILDHCEAFGLRLVDALLAKHEYNTSREYMHGGKAF